MSAIYGIVNFGHKPVDIAQLGLMQSTLNHWHADDKSIWHSGSVGMGHLMLWNTPESLSEKLPYYDNESRLCITADARIDNREELFAKLDLPKSRAAEIADSQLILKAYQKFGEDSVQHLIGDFAFAIWDEAEQKLFCARDQMGVRPFFYYQDAHFFAFATEKKALMKLDGIDLSINQDFLTDYICKNYFHALDNTIYAQISRLKPAHQLSLRYNNKTLATQRYWELDANTETKLANAAEYDEAFLHHFDLAVNCRSRSAYPVGAETSGGIDSSAVVGGADRFLKSQGKHLITFSNTLPDWVTDEAITRWDERRYIDAVLNFNNIKDFVYVTQDVFDDPITEIDFALEVNDGLEMWAPFWQLAIKKAVLDKGVRTLLTGFGGDQMVSNYADYYPFDLLKEKKWLAYILYRSDKLKGKDKIIPLIPMRTMRQLMWLKNFAGLYNDHTIAAKRFFKLPANSINKQSATLYRNPVFQERFNSSKHRLKHLLMGSHVFARIEAETRFGLYYKTEPRFPLLDIRLTQFYLSLPYSIKYPNNTKRFFFKNAVKQYLPEAIFQRDDKIGLVAPFQQLREKNSLAITKSLVLAVPNGGMLKKYKLLKRLTKMEAKIANEGHKPVTTKLNTRDFLPLPILLRWFQKTDQKI